jgi:hypothetical protein
MPQRQIRNQAQPVVPAKPQPAVKETLTQPLSAVNEAVGPPPQRGTAVGYLVCEHADFSAHVVSSRIDLIITTQAGKPITLPTGNHRFTDMVFSFPDADNKTWTVALFAPRGRRVAIQAGDTTSFPFGPPFTATLEAKTMPIEVSFQANILGRGYERYSIAHFRNPQQRVPTAKVRITDSAGRVLAEPELKPG